MLEQEKALKKINGSCVILAGAGTGKTYTIVEKVKYLIKNNLYRPEKIVCITFSNEATNNLMSRVRACLNNEEKEPIVKTFHAFSADLLREYGDLIGINKDFNILDSDEAKVILHRYLRIPAGNCSPFVSAIGTAKDLGIELEKFTEYLDKKISKFGGDIELLKKQLDNLEFELKTIYLRNEKMNKKEIQKKVLEMTKIIRMKKFLNAWKAYEKLKKLKNYQDYSDLNKNALELLKKNHQIPEKYDYIIVDEFQDTNKVQLDLLDLLSIKRNITVVGDLNQSIYRFRGAYNKNFQEFKERFSVNEKDIFNLNVSFRSSNRILKLAHKLILNNYQTHEECFEVTNASDRRGDLVEVYELKNAREEARKIAEIIEEEENKGIALNEICIMFRTHQQGKIIRRYLEFKQIPFVSITKNSLLKEKSVKMVIDYLKILEKIQNKSSGGEEAWWDLIYQLDFAEEDLIKIGRFIKDNRDAKNISILMLSSLCDLDLSEKGRIAGKVLIEKIKLLTSLVNKDVSEFVKETCNIVGLVNGQKTKEDKIIMLNLNRLYNLAKEHCLLHSSDLLGFIQYIDILNDLGIEIEAVDSEEEGVRLMTLHATKGLEYKTVIISNLAQKRFPIAKYTGNSLIPIELNPEFSAKKIDERDIDYFIHEYERQNQLYEERRLCYVAFTRSKDKLILTYAKEYGGRKFYPSQFLHEISYRENDDCSFFIEEEEKYEEPISSVSIFNFSSALSGGNFDSKILDVIKNSSREKFAKEKVFSQSSLLLFEECQKKYEYKYLYNMPEKKTIYWESLLLGSFVHRILETGVLRYFKSSKEFEDLAREMHSEADWNGVEIDDAVSLIKVFFERNKKKFGEHSRTEIKLDCKIGDIPFTGFADRIDFRKEGLEIIDYKTGHSNVSLKSRNWQLGYYALAAASLGKVKTITLDMLRHEKPLEFSVDEKGNASALNSDRIEGFNIYEIEQELIKTANKVLNAYESGFKACDIEKNCEFCNELIY